MTTKYWKLVNSVLIAMTIFGRAVFAADWYAEPSIGFEAGYDDNPALVTAIEESSLGDSVDLGGQGYGAVTGTILVGTESERESFQSVLSSRFRRYNESILDSEMIDASMQYTRSNLRNRFGLGVSYTEDSTLETEFLDTGELEFDVNRNEFLVEPTITLQLSEEMTGEAGLSFRKVTFDSISTSLIEFEETGVSSSLTKTVSERLDVSAGLQLILFKPTSPIADGAVREEQSYSVLVGADYFLRENLLLSVSVGPEFSERSFAGTELDDDSDTSVVYELGLSRTGFASSFSVTASRSVSSSALGGLVETDTYSFQWLKPGIAGGDLSSSLSYATRDDDPVLLTGRESYLFEIAYNKNITRALSYSLSYRYREEDEQILNETADSNTVNLLLQYNFGRKNLSN